MLKNYIRTAWRNLSRNPGYTSINVVGLAVGIAAVLLIFLYIRHEMSFDDYHEKKDRIYRLTSYGGFGEKDWHSSAPGNPVPELQTSYPRVEEATKIMRCGSDQIVIGDEIYSDIDMKCSDSQLFDIFSFEIVQGNPETTLDRPNTAVITRSLSRKLFGDNDPVGKTLPIHFGDNSRDFEITALMEDVPVNTHFGFDLLLSFESLRSTRRCLDCGGQMVYTLLKANADTEAISKGILNHIRETDGKTYVEDVALQPLEEIHFSSLYAERKGDLRYVYILSGIALVILFIACANYMNLATANYTRRTREIGVRKVLGSHRGQLMRQFLVESFVLTVLSLPVALVLLLAAIPFFNELAGTQLSLGVAGNAGLLASVAAVVLLVSVLAGSYPAFYLSSFHPASVLKGKQMPGSASAYLRKGLVVVQFLASIVMITLTFLVMQQLNYLQTRNLGFDTGQIILVPISDPDLQQKLDVVKQAFEQVVGVQNITAGADAPGLGYFGSTYIHRPEGKEGPHLEFVNPIIDEDFIYTYGLPLLAGENISEEIADIRDQEALINQTGLKAMNWDSPLEAIGSKDIPGFTIVGVVPDFNYQPLYHKIKPLLLQQNPWGRAYSLAIKIQSNDFSAVRDNLEAAWNSLGSLHPFEFSFLDDRLNQVYEQEQKTAQVIGLFAGISILIACMGLVGLAGYTAERRSKEIGIRKVFGATVPNIVYLLFRDFGQLVGLAFMISVPLVYVLGSQWLEEFAYRININGSLYALGLVITLLLVVLSTGCQSVKAALKNPADVIRYE